ncbi:MAG: SLC13 family permease [Eubacteriales bacterium]|nr:SLC13 family permease [Eubacteriales bacterium]
MLLAITGFVMIGLLMYFLLKGKAIPMSLFVILPILGAVINGFGLADITEFVKSGVSTTWSMAALFVFVVTYFGIMTDAGMFDRLVKKLIGVADGHVLGIFLVVVLIATLGHLDGNSPTTYLIAIPALLPLCKKLNIRITALMAVCCSVITVMNLVP